MTNPELVICTKMQNYAIVMKNEQPHTNNIFRDAVKHKKGWE